MIIEIIDIEKIAKKEKVVIRVVIISHTKVEVIVIIVENIIEEIDQGVMIDHLMMEIEIINMIGKEEEIQENIKEEMMIGEEEVIEGDMIKREIVEVMKDQVEVVVLIADDDHLNNN